MSQQRGVVDVAIENIEPGDAIAVGGDADPRSQVFTVAGVETVHPMAAGQIPRVVLTSTPSAPGGEPMVLEYPPGTVLRKIT